MTTTQSLAARGGPRDSRTLLILAAVLALGAGCDGEPPATPDGGPDDETDSGMTTDTPCQRYCERVLTTCTADNRQYGDEAECVNVCETAGWAEGDPVTNTGPAEGNTINCRTYHAGAAADDPALHCPHAGDTGGAVCGSLCEAYCSLAIGGCTGDDEIYANGEDCMAACEAFDDSGTIGATSGDTVQCRLYHVGVAIRSGETALHCPHAAPDGGGVCVGGWTFRTDDPTDYARVDRMGMPAVSTALVSSAMKDAYNDGDPSDDAAATFAPELIANLTGLHGALDDDLGAAGLTPCSMTPDPDCLTQEVAAGVSVQSLVVPDVLTINTGAAAGFPNGRRLADPVIDVTLAVVLLDLGTHAPDTLATVPVNPPANDVAFLDEFPYLAAPHAP